jgi:hypothetical protein
MKPLWPLAWTEHYEVHPAMPLHLEQFFPPAAWHKMNINKEQKHMNRFVIDPILAKLIKQMSRSLTFSRVEACIDIVELSLPRVDTEFSSSALARSCRPLTPEP